MKFNLEQFKDNQKDVELGLRLCADLTQNDIDKFKEVRQYEDNVANYLNSILKHVT